MRGAGHSASGQAVALVRGPLARSDVSSDLSIPTEQSYSFSVTPRDAVVVAAPVLKSTTHPGLTVRSALRRLRGREVQPAHLET